MVVWCQCVYVVVAWCWCGCGGRLMLACVLSLRFLSVLGQPSFIFSLVLQSSLEASACAVVPSCQYVYRRVLLFRCGQSSLDGWYVRSCCVMNWQCFDTAPLHGCVAAWLRGCVAAWLRGCVAAWLREILLQWYGETRPGSQFKMIALTAIIGIHGKFSKLTIWVLH